METAAQTLIERLQSVLEAGRSISADNEAKIKAAIASLQAALAGIQKEEQAEGDVAMSKESAAVAISEAAVLLTEVSVVQEATKSEGDAGSFPASDYAHVPDPSKPSTWKLRLTAKPGGEPDPGIVGAAAAALGPGYRGEKVQLSDGEHAAARVKVRAAWKKANPDKQESEMPSGIKESGAYTESDLIELREAGVLADVSSEAIPLIEKAIRDDGTMPVKLIAPGWGTSGYYSPDMLKRDGPKVFRSGVHLYVNHPTAQESQQRPERDIKDLAAVLASDAIYREDAAHGPGLYADAKVFSHWRPFVEEVAPYTGVSIRALGLPALAPQTIDGRKGKVIESLLAAQSVDFVTAPGAGGKVLQLFESARQYTEPKPKEDHVQESWTGEAFKQAQEADRKRIEELEERLRRADERDQLREAHDIIRRETGRAELPEQSRARVLAEVARSIPLTEAGAVDEEKLLESIRESVRQEAAYVTSLTGGGRIRGMGSFAGDAGFPEDQVKAAQTKLEESFKRMGMSPEAATLAAGGRR